MEIHPIAHFVSPFTSKFGIPKQSGLVEELEGIIVFEPGYRQADALRGLEGFDYLWLIWEFSANKHGAVSPVVRPPLLGGNVKLGVFATRSPFRPNPLGLSCVKIAGIDYDTPSGAVIRVQGADLMDETPIYDIKPYVVYADCHPDARSGFVDAHQICRLQVEIPDEIAVGFTSRELEALRKTLELDPRPHYQNDSERIYGMPFGHRDIRFQVRDGKLVVVESVSLDQNK